MATNDSLAEVCEVLYGDGAWELVSKLSDRGRKNMERVGLGATVIGAGLGVKELSHGIGVLRNGATAASAAAKPATGMFRKLPKLTPKQKGIASVGASTAMLGGDAAATYALGHKQKTVVKNYDFTLTGEISKMDTDKRQVFGWASIVEINGEPVVDLQGDYLPVDVLEKAAYEYVVKSRKGGDMHRRDGEMAFHASDLIESFIVTPEKKKALGLPDDFPTGWWGGWQVNDDDVWQLVKDGKRPEFSIHGSGQRVEKMLD